MTNPDPTKPVSNDEKFKPKNVAHEGAGSVDSAGRKDRNMDDTARGSEGDRRRASGPR